MLANAQGPLTSAFGHGRGSVGGLANAGQGSRRQGPLALKALLEAQKKPASVFDDDDKSIRLAIPIQKTCELQGGGIESCRSLNFIPRHPRAAEYWSHNNSVDSSSTDLQLVTHSLHQLLFPHTVPRTTCSLGHLYATVETLIHDAQRGEEVYQALRQEGEGSCVEISRIMKNAIRKQAMNWLHLLEEQWKAWIQRVETVRSALSHLDSGYVLHHAKQGKISSNEMLMSMFKQYVLDDEQIHEKALDSVVKVIDAERQTASTSSATPTHYQVLHPIILSLFMRLQAYVDLQTAIIECTKEYYAGEASRLATSSSDHDGGNEASSASTMAIESYLVHAKRRLDEEQARAEWLLSSAQGKKNLVQTVRSELIKHRSEWLAAGLSALLDQTPPPVESLKLLFQHLASVDELKTLSTAFVAHITNVGTAIVSPPSAQLLDKAKKSSASAEDKQAERKAQLEEGKIIDQLLEFKDRVDLTVEQAFEGNDEFKQRRKEAFEKVVNSRTGGAKVAELCAKYLDAKLRQGNRSMTDEKLESCLDEALALFRWTHAKDMFEEFYKRLFSKRLLLSKSASTDFEQMMLLKLKDECGPAFTQRLETMHKDITISEELMRSYNERQARSRDVDEQSQDPFDLNVNVLTQAHWPSFPTIGVQIPPTMAMASQRFDTFYQSRHSGRKLNWAHSLGTCTVSAKFPSGKKELLVSEFQAIVLLLFNGLEDKATLSYASIAEQTGMEELPLKSTLLSLACGKHRVLQKQPRSGEIDTEKDVFYFNSAFQHSNVRLTINQIQMEESKEEQQSTEHRVLLDRELVLQAATVRVMKAKKQLKHSELVQEVVDAIKSRFQVEISEIKKQFEILIEKEYMERVEDQKATYRYLA